jgi:hypothetical protein
MSDYWEKQFACANKKCNGTLIPTELVDNKKDNKVKATGKCPICKKTYQFSLPGDKEAVTNWIGVVFDHMFLCTGCGNSSLKTRRIDGHPSSGYTISVWCTRCNEISERKIDGTFFHYLGPKVLEVTQKETRNFCPNCGANMPLGSAFCAKCGTRIKK